MTATHVSRSCMILRPSGVIATFVGFPASKGTRTLMSGVRACTSVCGCGMPSFHALLCGLVDMFHGITVHVHADRLHLSRPGMVVTCQCGILPPSLRASAVVSYVASSCERGKKKQRLFYTYLLYYVLFDL
jgi:hypothetical protein